MRNRRAQCIIPSCGIVSSASPQNILHPEIAVLDSHNVLWVLCGARMGNEGYRKQHVTEAVDIVLALSIDSKHRFRNVLFTISFIAHSGSAKTHSTLCESRTAISGL